MKGTDGHHVIPVSLIGENQADNIIEIPRKDHRSLHNEQNVDYRYIRDFKEKTNGILIPDEYYFNEKEKLWKHYFKNIEQNPEIIVELQHKSLMDQANRYRNLNGENNLRVKPYNSYHFTEGMVEELIEQQKKRVKHLIA